MTELKLGSRWLMIVAVAGLITGVVTGLIIGWLVLPVEIANVDIFDLSPAAQEETLLLIANAYALDRDLTRAQERLAQLKDSKINDRIAKMAKDYEAQQKPGAANLAVLAIALGNTDQQIARIAATPTPTVTNTLTPTTTPLPTMTATNTPTLAPTATSASTLVPSRTATRRPVATATSKPAAIAPTTWLPAYPTEWPGGVRFEPANVPAGQKYWHLVRALYCDIRDTRFDCPNLPGGSDGIGIYVILAGGKAPLVVNGNAVDLEDKSGDPHCQCTYELFPDGKTIQVGSFPSDKISGLALSSVKTQIPQTHVRYFLTFQLVTK